MKDSCMRGQVQNTAWIRSRIQVAVRRFSEASFGLVCEVLRHLLLQDHEAVGRNA